jgi:hypothetical protein
VVVLAVALAGSSALASSAAAAKSKLVFKDSLAKASSALHPSDTATESLSFVHGKLRIVQKNQGAGLFVAPNFKMSTVQASRVDVAVDVTKNLTSTGAGVFCRRSQTGHYIFWVSGNHWGIFKSVGGSLNELVGGTSKAIRSGKASNRIEGRCDGFTPGLPVTLTLLVNGKKVRSFQDSTAPLPAGAVGMYEESAAGSEGDASFANFEVRTFSG